MFRKTDKAPIVIRANYITAEKAPDIEIQFQIKICRKKQIDGTLFSNFKNNNSMFDHCFTYTPKFVLRHGVWKTKNFEIILMVKRIDTIFKMHTWNVDVAPLFQRDTISQHLRASFPEFNTIDLYLTLYRGKPDTIPPFSKALFETRSKYRSRTKTIENVSTFFFDGDGQCQRLLHGLSSLQKINVNDNDLHKDALNEGNNDNCNHISPNQDQEKKRQSRTSSFGTKRISETLNTTIENLSQDFVSSESSYENGIPFYGMRVLYEFTKQLRGTSFDDPIRTIYISIEKKSKESLQSLILSLISCTYITITLKYHGFPYWFEKFDLYKQMHDLFDMTLSQLKTNYFSDPDIVLSHEIFNYMNDLFDVINDSLFGEYISNLILCAVIADIKPKLTKEYIEFFNLGETEFIDTKLCETDALEFITADKLKVALHGFLDEAPIPPCTFSQLPC